MWEFCQMHRGYQSEGGVCSGCLQERLNRLWRGEDHVPKNSDWDIDYHGENDDDYDGFITEDEGEDDSKKIEVKEGGPASRRINKQSSLPCGYVPCLHVGFGSLPETGEPISREIKSSVKEWVACRFQELIRPSVSSSLDGKHEIPHEFESSVENCSRVKVGGPDPLTFVRTNSEQKARREVVEDRDPTSSTNSRRVLCLNSVWPVCTRNRKASSKLVTIVVSPLMPSNKVCPSKSREDLMCKAGAHSRITTIPEDSRERTGEPFMANEIEIDAREEGRHIPGMNNLQGSCAANSELYPKGLVEGFAEGITTVRREASKNKVISWLQSFPSPKTAHFQKFRQPQPVSSASGPSLGDEKMETCDEEMEIVSHLTDELSQDLVSAAIPPDMSSFRMFLVSASQRRYENFDTCNDPQNEERMPSI